jgi:hypothetical protein
MKIKLHRPSPAMVVAMIALFASLGGSALAVSRGAKSSERAAARGKLAVKDTTPLDGSFFFATGHAICKRENESFQAACVRSAVRPPTSSTYGWLKRGRSLTSAGGTCR